VGIPAAVRFDILFFAFDSIDTPKMSRVRSTVFGDWTGLVKLNTLRPRNYLRFEQYVLNSSACEEYRESSNFFLDW
jgi:hypothetical protein